MGKEISNVVIFSLGQLLPNLNHTKSIAAFNTLAQKNFTEILWSKNELLPKIFELAERYKKGDIKDKKFRNTAKSLLFGAHSKIISDNDFDDAWNAMLGEIPNNLSETLQHLKKLEEDGVLVILLSDTNPIHKKYLLHNISLSENEMPPIYFSYEHKASKEDFGLYKKVLSDFYQKKHVSNPEGTPIHLLFANFREIDAANLEEATNEILMNYGVNSSQKIETVANNATQKNPNIHTQTVTFQNADVVEVVKTAIEPQLSTTPKIQY